MRTMQREGKTAQDWHYSFNKHRVFRNINLPSGSLKFIRVYSYSRPKCIQGVKIHIKKMVRNIAIVFIIFNLCENFFAINL